MAGRRLRSGGRSGVARPARHRDRRQYRDRHSQLRGAGGDPAAARHRSGRARIRALGSDLDGGPQSRRHAPPRRSGHLSLSAETARRHGRRPLGQNGAGPLSRRRLADPHRRAGRARPAAPARPLGDVPFPGRIVGAGDRRGRDRQCGRLLHRRQDGKHCDPQMSRRHQPAGLGRLCAAAAGAGACRHRRRARHRRVGAARGGAAAGRGIAVRDPARRRRRAWAGALVALAAAGLAALAVLTAGNRAVALGFTGGMAAALALFWMIGEGLVRAVRRLPRPRRPLLRLALANLARPGAATAAIMPSLGLGLSLFVTIALVEGNLAREVASRLPARAPSFFFIDIEPDQLAPFAAIVRAMPGARLAQVPMLRGRITRLNGVPVAEAKVAPGARWALDSDRGLTYSARLPAGSRLVAGKWWPPDYRGPPLVSLDADLARAMGLKLGDTLTVNLLGHDITARIANLRRIDWRRLGINFILVFAPGTLEKAPQTHLAAVSLPARQEERLLRRVTQAFPNVSAIPVRAALAAVGRLIATIGTAVRTAMLAVLAAGILVLGGALAAGHHRRVYDAVVLKILGATRATIAGVFLIEHAILGTLAALVAGACGTLAAYWLVTRVMGLDWIFLPGPLIAVEALATAAAVAFGFAGTWRALGSDVAASLRRD